MKFIYVVVSCLGVMIILSYLFAWYDIISNGASEYMSIVGSVRYYVLFVIPYWWVLILLGTLVLSLIYWVVVLTFSGLTK